MGFKPDSWPITRALGASLLSVPGPAANATVPRARGAAWYGTEKAALRLAGAQRSRINKVRRATVSVVIPSLNEEESIEWVLEQVPPWVSEVVLVDGLSVDLTEAIARTIRQDLIVVHQHAAGKGAAVRAGFAAARGDIVVMLDADGSTDPREITSFVDALEAGADFVKGSRKLKGGGSVDLTWLRGLGNQAFVSMVNLLFRQRFTDLCYGYCAFWRRDLALLALSADGFEIETELVLNAARLGLRIREVPSVELPRRGGASNLHAFKDGRRVLRAILRERVRRRAPTELPSGEIRLLKFQLPSVESEAWLPAGYDRRRGERRGASRTSSRYRGPERRASERRKRVDCSASVYVAMPIVNCAEHAPSPAILTASNA